MNVNMQKQLSLLIIQLKKLKTNYKKSVFVEGQIKHKNSPVRMCPGSFFLYKTEQKSVWRMSGCNQIR